MISTETQTTFLSEDFLLKNQYARILFHGYAKDLPILDYHNHLPSAEITKNRIFENISQIWLAGDHYKWRAMRTLGISEEFITGKAPDKDKFMKWSATVPYTMRNPLYHWTHLELKRYFGIDEVLNAENGSKIYDQTFEMLSEPDFSAPSLLRKMNVEVVCTTDDPADTLENHVDFHQQEAGFQMFPAFRPDKSFAVENTTTYLAYLNRLSAASGIAIEGYDELLEALSNRIDYFHDRGCRLSDHGLEHLYFEESNELKIENIFNELLEGRSISNPEIRYFKFYTLRELCKMYHAKGWVQQFHIGALRNTNSRMLSKLGPDTGFDSIGDFEQARPMANFLNELDSSDQLTKTILYNLNPRDNEVVASMIGNFNDGSVKGKIQFGSGWWYLDQIDGMEKQINTLSNMGLLSCFIGMLTDSRSFLSFPRHEYFRRILCNLIGKDVANGELPWDEKWLGKIIQDICYHNAKSYFDFSPKNFKI